MSACPSVGENTVGQEDYYQMFSVQIRGPHWMYLISAIKEIRFPLT